jgi:hypothetical protein
MNSSKSSFAATIIVLVLAIAAAVFAFWRISGNNSEETIPQDLTFTPPPELEDEMKNAAERLIKNNHTLITLYITRGLPKRDEPYGNIPEFDLYLVDSDEFILLEDIENIVRETFFPEEAERIINNRLDDGGRYYNLYIDKVYDNRETHNGPMLGIHRLFVPDTDYPISWENVSYSIEPVSEFEVKLGVKLLVHGNEAIFERTMYNLSGTWLLDRFIHYRADGLFAIDSVSNPDNLTITDDSDDE